jgi:VWFA-related protein
VSTVPAPPDNTTTESPRQVVRVDAIVTDRQGRPITNLRPADFEVRENGVAQKIDGVVLTARTPQAGAAAPREAVHSPEDEERASREAGTRIIALYLDEFHVSAGTSTDRAREAALRFLDEQVRPADLLIVLKPLDHLTEIRFTRDRAVARQAVESFAGRKDDYTPRTPFEEEYMGRSPDAVRAARAQIVMSGLRAVAIRMGELDGGLAALVLFTEGFDGNVPMARDRRLPDLQGLVRAASRFRVAFYALDPSPVAAEVPPPTAADTETVGPTVSTLQTLARQTGGDAAVAGQDLTPLMRAISRDLDSYYVLTYTPAGPSDGRFRKLQVTASRRDAQVRTRSGYWAPLPTDLRSTRATAPAIVPMRAIKRSPLIDSWIGTSLAPNGKRQVIFTWVPASGVTRTGKPLARADIVSLKVTTPAGAVLFEGDVSPARGSGVTTQRNDAAKFEASAGRLQLDMTILQADGTKLDVGAQDFDLPEFRAGSPIILQPQLFRAASAREFRDVSTDPNAAPLPTREFRRTDRVLLRVPTFDPSGAEVRVSVKLMNRVGSSLEDLAPMAPDPALKMDQFDLPLAKFAPGEYAIEITAQSTSGSARELIRLHITG